MTRFKTLSTIMSLFFSSDGRSFNKDHLHNNFPPSVRPSVSLCKSLRLTNQHQLIVPRCRRITHGRRAFSVAGPTVWNSLPTEFRGPSVGFGD